MCEDLWIWCELGKHDCGWGRMVYLFVVDVDEDDKVEFLELLIIIILLFLYYDLSLDNVCFTLQFWVSYECVGVKVMLLYPPKAPLLILIPGTNVDNNWPPG